MEEVVRRDGRETEYCGRGGGEASGSWWSVEVSQYGYRLGVYDRVEGSRREKVLCKQGRSYRGRLKQDSETLEIGVEKGLKIIFVLESAIDKGRERLLNGKRHSFLRMGGNGLKDGEEYALLLYLDCSDKLDKNEEMFECISLGKITDCKVDDT